MAPPFMASIARKKSVRVDALGEHTQAVLEELGYTQQAIAELAGAKVV